MLYVDAELAAGRSHRYPMEADCKGFTRSFQWFLKAFVRDSHNDSLFVFVLFLLLYCIAAFRLFHDWPISSNSRRRGEFERTGSSQENGRQFLPRQPCLCFWSQVQRALALFRRGQVPEQIGLCRLAGDHSPGGPAEELRDLFRVIISQPGALSSKSQWVPG